MLRDEPCLAPTDGEAADGGVQNTTIQVRRLRVTLDQLLVDASRAFGIAQPLERLSQLLATSLVQVVSREHRAELFRGRTVRLRRFASTPLLLQHPRELREGRGPGIPLQRRPVGRFRLHQAALVLVCAREPAMQLGVGRVARHGGLEDRGCTGPVALTLEAPGTDDWHETPPALHARQ